MLHSFSVWHTGGKKVFWSKPHTWAQSPNHNHNHNRRLNHNSALKLCIPRTAGIPCVNMFDSWLESKQNHNLLKQLLHRAQGVYTGLFRVTHWAKGQSRHGAEPLRVKGLARSCRSCSVLGFELKSSQRTITANLPLNLNNKSTHTACQTTRTHQNTQRKQARTESLSSDISAFCFSYAGTHVQCGL